MLMMLVLYFWLPIPYHGDPIYLCPDLRLVCLLGKLERYKSIAAAYLAERARCIPGRGSSCTINRREQGKMKQGRLSPRS